MGTDFGVGNLFFTSNLSQNVYLTSFGVFFRGNIPKYGYFKNAFMGMKMGMVTFLGGELAFKTPNLRKNAYFTNFWEFSRDIITKLCPNMN